MKLMVQNIVGWMLRWNSWEDKIQASKRKILFFGHLFPDEPLYIELLNLFDKMNFIKLSPFAIEVLANGPSERDERNEQCRLSAVYKLCRSKIHLIDKNIEMKNRTGRNETN